MVTGLGIFGESTNDVFENIAHFHTINGLGIKVNFRELFHHTVQTVILVHLLNLLLEFQIIENYLHIGREALDIADEVLSNIVTVIQQPGQGKFAGVVEGVAGCFLQQCSGQFRIRLVLVDNGLLGICKRTFKAAQDDHGNDNILVFIGGIGTAQGIGDGPHQGDLFAYINRGIIKHYIVVIYLSHCRYLLLSSSGQSMPALNSYLFCSVLCLPWYAGL